MQESHSPRLPLHILRRIILGLSIFLVVVLIVTVIAETGQERRHILKSARARTENIAHILENQTTAAFFGVDRLLTGIAEVLRLHPDALTPGAPDIHALLLRRLATSPIARDLLIADATGKVINVARNPEPPNISLADRSYFLAQRERSVGLFIGEPVKSRVDGATIIPVSIRLDGADGQFAGIIGATITAEHFQDFFRETDMGTDGTIALLRNDGQILASFPFEQNSSAILARDIVSERVSERYALRILVALSRNEVLREKGREGIDFPITLGFLGSLLIAAFCYLALRQIAAQEKMLKRLEQARDEAEAARSARDDFLSRMSHELRSPLTSILGFSELMGALDPARTGAETMKRYAQDIHASGKHLLMLIDDVLEMTNLHAGQRVLTWEEIDIHDLFAICQNSLRAKAEAKKVTFEVTVPAGILILHADRVAIERILGNLLENALRYSPEGGRIHLSATRIEDQNAIRIAVKDDGPGIPDEIVAAIGQPFLHPDDGGQGEGTGLGLALVKELTALHKGQFFIGNAENGGCLAEIILPQAQDTHTSNSSPIAR